tara:strand:+ start:1911 stop:2051 length:141 start_codon:yes stop_codon:yes gene_type:complete
MTQKNLCLSDSWKRREKEKMKMRRVGKRRERKMEMRRVGKKETEIG